jgi:hypothetical protein
MGLCNAPYRADRLEPLRAKLSAINCKLLSVAIWVCVLLVKTSNFKQRAKLNNVECWELYYNCHSEYSSCFPLFLQRKNDCGARVWECNSHVVARRQPQGFGSGQLLISRSDKKRKDGYYGAFCQVF